MSVISGTTKTLPNLEATSEIGDDDLIYVELAQGGSRKMTFADLLSCIGGAMAREQQCINGSRAKGIEWDVDELMTLVRNGDFDKFAIGDYITDSSTSIEFAIAAKNHYSPRAFGSGSPDVNHIVLMPFTPLATEYTFNSSNTNTGGYAGSDMPAHMETEYAKLSEKIRSYCRGTSIFENNKGAWSMANERYMRLPTVVEVTGNAGWAGTEGYSNGISSQLPLCRSSLFRVPKDGSPGAYWLLDPSSYNTTMFCWLRTFGDSYFQNASEPEGVRPLIVMA